MDVIIDLETIDTIHSSGVLSIGVIAFDALSDLSFDELVESGIELKLDIKSQLSSGRTYSKDTMDWWSMQDSDAKRVLKPLGSDLSVIDAMTSIKEYLDDMGRDKKSMVYVRRPQFDIPIINDMLFGCGLTEKYFWNFWNIRDVCSIIDTLTNDNSGKLYKMKADLSNMIPHNALHDCATDILMIQEAYSL